MHVFVLRLRKRNDSSDTCVASVTMSDGLALVKFAMHAEPRRFVVKHSQNETSNKPNGAWDLDHITRGLTQKPFLQGYFKPKKGKQTSIDFQIQSST